MHAFKVLALTIPRIAKVFSGGSVLSFNDLLLRLWYFAVSRKSYKRGLPMKFSFQYEKKIFDVTLHSPADLAVLDEVFIQKEYAWALPFSPQIIIDLGAHFGDTALYYHATYPDAKIIALEPSPQTYARLCLNVKEIEQIVPVQAGIAEKDGVKELYIGPSSIGDSFSHRSGTTMTVSVPVYTLRSLLDMYAVERADLVKFDIEGAEELLFQSEDPSSMARAYIGEVHSDLMSISDSDFLKYFREFDIQTEALKNKKRMIVRGLLKSDETF